MSIKVYKTATSVSFWNNIQRCHFGVGFLDVHRSQTYLLLIDYYNVIPYDVFP